MISVIFPTRNRAELLNDALHSLSNQTMPPEFFEVIVIDNGSTDHTHSVASKWSDRMDNFNHFHEPEPGLHAGRHRGVKESAGDILVFSDDDIVAFPTWIAAIADVFQDSTVAMAGGNNLPMFMGSPPAWLDALWNQRAHDGSRSLPWLSIQERAAGRYPISPYLVWGCNFAIRKDVLQSAGGFHPDGMPRELIRYRGDGETHVSRYVAENDLKCLYDSEASIYHKVTLERMSFAYFRQRGFDQGVSDSFTQLREGEVQDTPKILLPVRLLRGVWRRLRHVMRSDPQIADMQRAIKEYQTGHREGFAYHQLAYREDAEVKAWVHREYYY